MSFFKHGEAWLKDALNKVESQLDKAFEIPKDSTNATSLSRSSSFGNDLTTDTTTFNVIRSSHYQSPSTSTTKDKSSFSTKSTSDLTSKSSSSSSSSVSLSSASSIASLSFSPISSPLKTSNSIPLISDTIQTSSKSSTSSSSAIHPANIPLPPDSPVLSRHSPIPSIAERDKTPSPSKVPTLKEKEITSKLSSKDEHIRSLVQENEHLQSDLTRSRETIKKLLVKVQTNEAKLRELDKHKNAASGTHDGELKSLQSELEYWKTQAQEPPSKLSSSPSQLNSSSDTYRIALESELQKSLVLQSTLESTKKELQATRSQLDKLQTQLNLKETELQDTEAQLHAEIDQYRAQLLEMQKNFDITFQKTTFALTSQLQQAESSMKSTEVALIEREKQLVTELVDSKNSIKNLESRLELLNLDHQQLLTSHHELENKLKQLHEEYDLLQRTNLELKVQVDTLSMESLTKISNSEDVIGAASQTDISALSGSNESIFLTISSAPVAVDSSSEVDSISSKGSSRKSLDRNFDSNSSLSSRRMSMDLLPGSPHLANTLKTQLSILQTAKEHLTLQVVHLMNENSSMKAQLEDLMKENQILNDNYQTVLELLGEKEEEIADCRLTLKDAKEAYKQQLEMLMTRLQKD